MRKLIKLLFLFILLIISSIAYSQCPTIVHYNSGNGGASTCPNVGGTPYAANFVGTQYATVPTSTKTGDINFKWASTVSPPAISAFYSGFTRLADTAGPSDTATVTGAL